MRTQWIRQYETKTRIYSYVYNYGTIKPKIYWKKKGVK